MVELIRGCNISLKFSANELTSNNASVRDGTRLIFPVVTGDDGTEYKVIPSDQFK